MGNSATQLPTDVDSFLMDMAQIIKFDDIEMTYTDIYDFANRATNDDISLIRLDMGIIADYNFDIGEKDVKNAFKEIINITKGIQHA